MFGTKLAMVEISGLPKSIRNIASGRGMRHRSMAATVAAIPDSSGVVVSQDGDATFFCNRHGSLCGHQEEYFSSEENAVCQHLDEVRAPRLHELLIPIMKNNEQKRSPSAEPAPKD
jgi:hypothetical protein